jgi:Tfp pilus assembly protein PilN
VLGAWRLPIQPGRACCPGQLVGDLAVRESVVRDAARALKESSSEFRNLLRSPLKSTWAVFSCEGTVLLGRREAGSRRIRCSTVGRVSDVREHVGRVRRYLADIRILLPRHRLTCKYVKLPTVEPGEAATMLGYEVPGLVPYDSGDIVYDYYLAKTSENGYVGAYVVIGQREQALKDALCAAEAGLFPQRLMATSSAFLNWFLHYREGRFGQPEILAVLCAEFLEVLVVASDRILFSRSVPLGSGPTDIEAETAAELARSLQLYSASEAYAVPSGVSILSDMPALKGRVLDVAAACSAPVSWLTEDTEDALFLGHTFQDGDSLPPSKRALLLGALLPFRDHPAISLNLLPEHLLERRRRWGTWVRLAANTGVLALNLFLVGLLCSSAGDVEEARLQALERERQELGPASAEVTRKRDQMTLMKRALQTQQSSLMLLAELHRITPTEVAISRLTFGEGGNVRLEGHATELSHVFAFMNILQGSPRFEAVNYIQGGAATVGDRKYARFVLEMHVR